jgi:hypothetical protein
MTTTAGEQFEQFWLATGERPFDALVDASAECYRLSVRSSQRPDHRIVRLQRPSLESAAGSELVAHYFQFGADKAASAWTHRIPLELRHWTGLAALFGVAEFWELPERIDRGGLDGATYTLEAFRDGRRHRIERWSPHSVASGGELVCVVTDYLEQLAWLAAYRCELYQRYG